MRNKTSQLLFEGRRRATLSSDEIDFINKVETYFLRAKEERATWEDLHDIKDPSLKVSFISSSRRRTTVIFRTIAI